MNIIVGTLLIIFLLNYLVLRPIRIINQISQFDEGNTDARLSFKNKDEFFQLGEKLNQYFSRIVRFNQMQADQLTLVEERTNQVARQIIQLKKRIDTIKAFSQNLAGQSQEQVAAFEETASISVSMSEEMQKVKNQLEQLAETFEGVQSKADDVIQKIQHVSTTFTTLKSKVSEDQLVME